MLIIRRVISQKVIVNFDFQFDFFQKEIHSYNTLKRRSKDTREDKLLQFRPWPLSTEEMRVNQVLDYGNLPSVVPLKCLSGSFISKVQVILFNTIVI